MEEWRIVEEFPKYEVSNCGNIRSLDYNHTGKPKLLKPGKSSCGYLVVVLWKERKKTCCLLHRLIAKAFLNNPNNLKYINHKDENKENNCVENLEWCTHEYNCLYGTKQQRCATALKDNPLITKPVYQLDRNGNITNEYTSITRAAEAVGGKIASITRVCCGYTHRHTAYGYSWKFK